MKLFNVLAALAITTASLTAFGTEGAGGHGGGGILRKGVAQSFYGAGFYTEPVLESDGGIDVPQMNLLIAKIQTFPSMSADSRGRLLSAIVPSDARTYFKIDAATFDATTRARLIEQYADITKQPKTNLDVFAVTDIAKKQTFLLPGFYRLSAMDQMAILFHEAFWIMNPDATYDYVVKAEMAFEAVLDRPADAIRVLEFMKYYSSHADQLKAAIAYDKKNGTLPPPFLLSELMGTDALRSIANGNVSWNFTAPLYLFSQKYSRSATVRLLKAAMNSTDQYQRAEIDDKAIIGYDWVGLRNPVDVNTCVIDLNPIANPADPDRLQFAMTCNRGFADINVISISNGSSEARREAKRWNREKTRVVKILTF